MKIWYLIALSAYLPSLLYALVKTITILFRLIKTIASLPLRRFFHRGSLPQFENWNKKLSSLTNNINFGVGLIEYYLRAPRNYLIGTLFLILLIIRSIPLIKGEDASIDLWNIGIPLIIVVLTCSSAYRQLMISLKMAEYLRAIPNMHPSSYFHSYYRLLGPFPTKLTDPKEVPTISPEKVSFKKHVRSKQSSFIMLPAVWDTAHLAHACLRALKFVGKEYAREVFDIHASMWGKRILQLSKASLEVSGTEQLKNLKGKILLIFNHKSQLDFALTFFALSGIGLGRKREIRPRFITAKDHFVDNIVVYEMIGIGKLIEAVDMVFIDRKKGGRGMQDLRQAAEFLSKKEIEIAIYPQGTRAEGNIDRSGKRRDAGYYTTFSPKSLASDMGHLKKGTAYLAVDTLISLAKGSGEDLHLVFVGIRGTATIMAKQSLKIQTESDIEFVIGPPLTLSASLAQGLQKPSGPEPALSEEKRYLELVSVIHQKIDAHLAECTGIHENLRHRFLLDLQGNFRFSLDRIQSIEKIFDRLSQESTIFYQILDRIYACPVNDWNPYLSEFSHLLMENTPHKRFEALREQVSLRMLESLKTKVHGKKVKKGKLKKQNPYDSQPGR